jgi:hypothetical protein
MSGLRRITDGVLFQAVLTGSLSFSHIHDLAAAHGQTGWKAWLYPLSVDLLTVAAYRKLMAARRVDGAPVLLAWCSFLLGLSASLAANVISAWQNPDRLIAVALGVWPAVAFLVCTLLSHDPAAPAPATASAPALPPVPQTAPAPAEPMAPAVPSLAVPDAEPPAAPELPDVAPNLLSLARRIADQHHAQHGTPIDAGTLRARLNVGEPLVQAVHAHLTANGSAGA